jgi:hypothetical protein
MSPFASFFIYQNILVPPGEIEFFTGFPSKSGYRFPANLLFNNLEPIIGNGSEN